MADAAQRFAGNWFRNRPSPALLVLFGRSGTGKSHTVNRLVEYTTKAASSSMEAGAWAKVPDSLFLRWPEVCSAFDEGEHGVMVDAFNADLLFLDDVGAENDPWKKHVDPLCQILSRRERKFTVLTTNIESGSWATRFDGRVEDRLMRNSDVVQLKGVTTYQLR